VNSKVSMFPNTTEEADLCPSLSDKDQTLVNQLNEYFTGIIKIVICSVGILTTFVSLTVLAREHFRKNIFHQLLLCLSASDLLHLLCNLIHSIGSIWTHYPVCTPQVPDCNLGVYLYSFLTPHLLHPLIPISMTASIFLVIALAFERSAAVTRPLARLAMSSGLLWRYLLPVVVFAFSINAPKFNEFKIFHTNSTHFRIWPTEMRMSHFYVTYNSWIRMVVLGVLPFLALAALNLRIYQAILSSRGGTVQSGLKRNFSRAQRRGGGNDNEGHDRTQLTILLSIVCIFLICSIPRSVILMHEVWILDTLVACIKAGKPGYGFPVWNLAMGHVSDLLLAINPSLNFLVYSAVNKRFRKALWSFLPCSSSSSSPLHHPRPTV